MPGTKVVDHINCDGLDNRRENIASITTAENVKQHRICRRNKTGIAGVHRAPDKYVASWREPSGRIRDKSYTISKYGEAKALELAVKARTEMEAVLGLVIRTPAKRPRGPEDNTHPVKRRRMFPIT